VNGAVALGDNASGTLKWPEDVNDVYKKSLTAGTYKVTIDGDAPAAGTSLDVYAWAAGSKEIWQLPPACYDNTPSTKCPMIGGAANGATSDESFNFVAPTSGTYYIQVSSWFTDLDGYTVSIEKL
jgi:hypothetical protein